VPSRVGDTLLPEVGEQHLDEEGSVLPDAAGGEEGAHESKVGEEVEGEARVLGGFGVYYRS